jgi:PEP-CTERM motif
MSRPLSLAACLIGGAALLGASSARADVTLLSVTDTSALFATQYVLDFTAPTTQPSTTISFQGYNASDFEYVYGISVTRNGGANLLGDTWTKTPAGSGSYAYQTTTLEFGDVSGESDSFSQTFATTPGAQYVLTFDFAGSTFAFFDLSSYSSGVISRLSEVANSNSLQVIASGSAASVPEPSTWAMMLIGLAGLGSVRYRWRGRSVARGRESQGSFP